jgi:hypothetical protein
MALSACLSVVVVDQLMSRYVSQGPVPYFYPGLLGLPCATSRFLSAGP